PERAGERPEPAVPEDEAVGAGGLAGGDEPVAQAKVAAQVEGMRLGIEEAVGSGFDPEAAAALGPDVAAGPGRLFEERDRHARGKLAEAKGQRQPSDPAANDDDLGHGLAATSPYPFPSRLGFRP